MVSLRFKTIQKLVFSDRELWEETLQAYNPDAFSLYSEMGDGHVRQCDNNLNRAGVILNELGYSHEQIENKIKVAAKLLLDPLPKHLSASQTGSHDDYFLFDLWLSEEVPQNSLIFVKFESKQCDWASKKVGVNKPWHASCVLALAYIKLLEATLILGAPDEGLKYRTEVNETLIKFSYILIKKSDEALLYCDAKFKSAIGGKKGSRPMDTRWEKFARQTLQNLPPGKIESHRYKSGDKEGQIHLNPIAALIGPEIQDRCKDANIDPPGIYAIKSRLQKLFDQLNIKKNKKIQRS